VAQQGAVLEPGSVQAQQADELVPDVINHHIGRPGGLGQRRGVVYLRTASTTANTPAATASGTRRTSRL